MSLQTVACPSRKPEPSCTSMVPTPAAAVCWLVSADRHHRLAQRSVKNVCQYLREFLSTVPQNPSWDVIWASCFLRVEPPVLQVHPALIICCFPKYLPVGALNTETVFCVGLLFLSTGRSVGTSKMQAWSEKPRLGRDIASYAPHLLV